MTEEKCSWGQSEKMLGQLCLDNNDDCYTKDLLVDSLGNVVMPTDKSRFQEYSRFPRLIYLPQGIPKQRKYENLSILMSTKA